MEMNKGMRMELSPDGQEIILHIPITVLAEEVRPKVVPGAANLREFTSREKEVFEELRRGKINKEIAWAANIAERTVKFHVSNIYRKLRVGGREDILRLYGSSQGQSTGRC